MAFSLQHLPCLDCWWFGEGVPLWPLLNTFLRIPLIQVGVGHSNGPSSVPLFLAHEGFAHFSSRFCSWFDLVAFTDCLTWSLSQFLRLYNIVSFRITNSLHFPNSKVPHSRSWQPGICAHDVPTISRMILKTVPGRKPSHQSLRRRRKTPCFLDVSFSLYVLIYITFKLCRRPLLKVMKRWQSMLWQTKCLVAIRKTWRIFRWKRSFVVQLLWWKVHCPFHSWCWPIWFVGLGIATQAGCVSALCDVEVGSSNERSHRDHGSSRENVRLMSPMRMWSHAPGGTHVQWKRAAIASCDHFFKACNGLGPWAAGDHEDACHCVYEQKAPISAQLMQISAKSLGGWVILEQFGGRCSEHRRTHTLAARLCTLKMFAFGVWRY